MSADDPKGALIGRREVVLGGVAAATVGGLGCASASGQVAPSNRPAQVQAFAASSEGGPFAPLQIERRAVRPNDVDIEVLYAGICHSDIHAVNNDWGENPFPLVPGHEIVGRVRAVGSAVSRFRVGDAVGVGCMVDSCGTCVNCQADREQNCVNGTTFTYGSEDKVSGGYTQGGYSKRMVVQEHFVVALPDGIDLSRAAPVLCAGITTFSPMQHWRLARGQRVGVIGVGGLGHMAVKLGVARGARVTGFTTTTSKVEAIQQMGADAVEWSDRDAMCRLRGTFDLMIATVPEPFQVQQFMDLLKLDATLVNVGQLGTLDGLSGMRMGFGRHSLAGSMIGGMAETQEVVDYCARHDVWPDVELIRPSEIDAAYRRVQGKDVRFRFVIDMSHA